MQRRDFIQSTAAALTFGRLSRAPAATARRPPNFIIIFCDDLGYGDIGAYGATRVRTPHLDRMAREGLTLTDFYAAANLCTPSRAGLMTGRYPIRAGLAYEVVMQNDNRGLHPSEVTIAEALKPDYATAMIGKWHLGHRAPFWPPTVQGFDLFFGLPYSHDMLPLGLYESGAPGVELTREDVVFTELQQRFVARTERFIEANRHRPFYVQLSLSAPHLPGYPHAAHAGHSKAGVYGDVIEEIDALSGRLLAKIKRLGLDRDTLVIFTSDNGPWFEGSSGSLRQRKGGGGYDGGYRVPFIARWPGKIPARRRVNSIAMAIDLLPTFCSLAGRAAPAGLLLDGRDLSEVLLRGAKSPHEELVLFDNEEVVAIRTQRWKYIANDYYRAFGSFNIESRGYPQLYDMSASDAEDYSVADRHPDVLAELQRRMARAREQFAPLKIPGVAEAWQESLRSSRPPPR
jgi:arylsulfatase A